jgi:hypothetical protein
MIPFPMIKRESENENIANFVACVFLNLILFIFIKDKISCVNRGEDIRKQISINSIPKRELQQRAVHIRLRFLLDLFIIFLCNLGYSHNEIRLSLCIRYSIILVYLRQSKFEHCVLFCDSWVLKQIISKE